MNLENSMEQGMFYSLDVQKREVLSCSSWEAVNLKGIVPMKCCEKEWFSTEGALQL